MKMKHVINDRIQLKQKLSFIWCIGVTPPTQNSHEILGDVFSKTMARFYDCIYQIRFQPLAQKHVWRQSNIYWANMDYDWRLGVNTDFISTV